VAIGVLLGAIQWLPTLDAAAQSTRVQGATDFALTYSLHPTNLIQLWSPLFFRGGAHGGDGRFHEYGLYSGAFLTVALMWVWTRRPALPERRRLIGACTILAAFAFILALGQYGGIGLAFAHLPLLQSLRAPARHIVLVQFALAILAAVAFEDLQRIAERPDSRPASPGPALWIPALLGVGTTIALNSGLLGYGRQTFETAGHAAPGVALIAAVTLLVYVAGRNRIAWALPALVVVTTLDLGLWGMLFVYRDPVRRIDEIAATAPRAPSEPEESYAFATRYSPYFSNVLILRGYRLTSGYAGLFPASRHPLEGESARKLSGTRWLFPPDGVRRPFDGVARVRLLDEHDQPSTGSVRMAVDRPGRLAADVDAPSRRIVAFTERFHDGWSATSGGARLQTVRVEGDFLGCIVDGGAQRITLHFMPRSFVYGSVLSTLGMVALAGILFLKWK
jgi:hypothetical protein